MMKKPTHRAAPGAARTRSRKDARRTPGDRTSSATEAREGPRTMTRECRAQLAELLAYLDGELPARRRLVIERHVNACSCCRGLAMGVRRAILLCRDAGPARLPAAVRARARARIRDLLGGSARLG
jgi:anti-sigma factor RsiW